ncbi:IclR family transcriptional regulator [Arenibacterium halophilum]|uniref:IclR family transcriptional regulator n=1 Tax=Arenibacterium halophilum TaxID=2583821 RepID=A0ABY2X1W5_9RHOB|nr:IclR family transcriptional regulator [Arenibacterium halophilum]MAY88181.1 IclR family transcriptional regulator [Pseudooceanicola sp.]TMV09257.1 IclR family transcriptional regulator [Arenibacterium halophilum]
MGKDTGSGMQKVEAVERALDILEAFADGTEKLTLKELTERTGFYRSTLLRLAASLERYAYLHRDEEGYFRLGPSLWRLGVIFHNSYRLETYVRPVLAHLTEQLDETSTFYVRQGNHRVCLYRHHARRMLRHHLEEGAMLPLDSGAGGHVLCAFTGEPGDLYDQVRAQGYYISRGERDRTSSAIAAPVLGPKGELIGALSVVGLLERFDGDAGQEALREIRLQAQKLSEQLGYRAHPGQAVG